ncbi:MAG: replicative DNA helicase [Clostridia bacterium]|nr:replicative DNA helicase [Clostridia bacterium]
MIIDRELPFSREAEEGVAGCILSNGSSISDAVEIVSPGDFFLAPAREIYAAAIELFNDNKPIDFVTIAEILAKYDKLDGIGGSIYLANLASSVSTTENISYYANIIKQKALLRQLINAGTGICKLAYDDNDEVDRILNMSEQMILDVSAAKEKTDIVPVSDVVMESYEMMVENSKNAGKVNGLDTGFRDLNIRTGGFHGGELILIAGRPGMGKSSFAVNIAEHVAFSSKETVAIFNLEMPKAQVVNRIMCSQALVDSNKIKSGELTPDDWMSVGRVMNKFYQAPMYIDDTPTISVSEIRAKCRRLKQTKNLKLIVIDYLQLMQSSRRTESRQQEISDISRSLKILAKELDVPVVALSQLSRNVESRSDKRPMLSDLRESGAIEQDADIVMFLYRDDYYNKESSDKGLAECIIAKHRSGETGMFKLGWQGSYTKFRTVNYDENEKNNSKNNQDNKEKQPDSKQ